MTLSKHKDGQDVRSPYIHIISDGVRIKGEPSIDCPPCPVFLKESSQKRNDEMEDKAENEETQGNSDEGTSAVPKRNMRNRGRVKYCDIEENEYMDIDSEDEYSNNEKDDDDNDDSTEDDEDYEKAGNRRKQHKRTKVRKTEEKIYQCTKCDDTFIQYKEFLKHESSHKLKNLYQCPKCNKFFSYKNGEETRKDRTEHQCPYCQTTIKDLVDFNTKLRSGPDADMFECVVCQKAFKEKWRYFKHAWRHSNIKKQECTFCDKTFNDKTRLMAHLRTHTNEKPYQCEKCDKSFKTKEGLNYHVLTHTGEKPHVCYICGKDFRDASHMRKHLAAHSGVVKQKPHQCDVCGKWLSRKDVLTDHMKTHTGEKPHTCTTCGKSFAVKQMLKDHMNIHTGERPHQCTICRKTFTQLSALSRHKVTHTGEKKYQCEFCSKRFSQKPHLQKHVRLSCPLKNKPKNRTTLTCALCGEIFIEEKKLKKHMVLHNKEDDQAKVPLPGSVQHALTDYVNVHNVQYNTMYNLNNFTNTYQGGFNSSNIQEYFYTLVCSVCNETFASREALNEHKLVHLEGKELAHCNNDEAQQPDVHMNAGYSDNDEDAPFDSADFNMDDIIDILDVQTPNSSNREPRTTKSRDREHRKLSDNMVKTTQPEFASGSKSDFKNAWTAIREKAHKGTNVAPTASSSSKRHKVEKSTADATDVTGEQVTVDLHACASIRARSGKTAESAKKRAVPCVTDEVNNKFNVQNNNDKEMFNDTDVHDEVTNVISAHKDDDDDDENVPFDDSALYEIFNDTNGYDSDETIIDGNVRGRMDLRTDADAAGVKCTEGNQNNTCIEVKRSKNENKTSVSVSKRSKKVKNRRKSSKIQENAPKNFVLKKSKIDKEKGSRNDENKEDQKVTEKRFEKRDNLREIKRVQYTEDKEDKEDSDSDECGENSADSDSDSMDTKITKRMQKSTYVRKSTRSKALLYQCPECKKFFSYGDNDSERTQHECPYCDVNIPNLVDFNTKLRYKFFRGEKTFKCSVCSRQFAKKHMYYKHAWRHSNVKQHQCADCDKSFVDKSHLEAHVRRTHTGERPFQCAECGKAFTYKHGLNLHAMTHSGEKPHHCSVCGKAYGQKGKYTRIYQGCNQNATLRLFQKNTLGPA